MTVIIATRGGRRRDTGGRTTSLRLGDIHRPVRFGPSRSDFLHLWGVPEPSCIYMDRV